MKTRYRTVAATAVVVTVAIGTTGCGRYSWSALKAQKAYKDANELYKGSDWKDAAAKYEYVLQQDPSRTEVYFFLANSYDNAYKPSRAGEADNDAVSVLGLVDASHQLLKDEVHSKCAHAFLQEAANLFIEHRQEQVVVVDQMDRDAKCCIQRGILTANYACANNND